MSVRCVHLTPDAPNGQDLVAISSMMIAMLGRHGGQATLTSEELEGHKKHLLAWQLADDQNSVSVFLIPRDRPPQA